MADYLHVNRKRIQKIISRRLSGHSFSETGRRPERIDQVGKTVISQTIKTAASQRKPLRKSESIELVKKVVIESDIRNGQNGLTSSIDRKTVSKILQPWKKDRQPLKQDSGKEKT